MPMPKLICPKCGSENNSVCATCKKCGTCCIADKCDGVYRRRIVQPCRSGGGTEHD